MRRKWHVELSDRGMQLLITQVELYQKQLIAKCQMFIDKLTKYGIQTIRDTAKKIKPNTYATIDVSGGIVHGTLVSEGEEILFYEFGTGVSRNGTPHSSPHPDGAKFGYTIGDYGKGHGLQEVWWFYDEKKGRYRPTHGIKAQMFVYKADIRMIMNFVKVAKEVFGS